ncbi:NAD(P)/FAD-dependent oxidoreductase [Rugosimonospora africana]|uniref:Pyridine nucleotide-disulfide oxidoreductase n=1 Tax=Rugosimonospora africana TaxID=556532 RepID=A0A8J3R174_9ACTN|nr:FAD-dependent oxidoreductase [Rugosimonospora africana]GIH20613.1 pyridine nucleotide-disulfide oxidoreductase [Rugosimonospora africana]
MDERVFVIVGASLTGAKAAEGLRDAGFEGKIMLIGEEIERPYERPPLSKGYLQGNDPRDGAFVHPEQWYAEHDVTLRLGTRVTALDPAAHSLTLDGVETVGYDKLLLATGSRVRQLTVPGVELNGVRYLRTMPESDGLRERLSRGGNVVVIGAGWIGLETAAAARGYGATVTVVELDTLPLRRPLGDELAAFFAELHKAHGVTLRFGAGVREFRGSAGTLTAVVLEDGTELPADLAIVGVGIQPATELAETSGLTVDNGIVTDAALRTSDSDVYAAGDVASTHNALLGRPIRVEHWANALNGGEAAGRSMAGEDVTYDRVPYFFTDQYDLGMEYSGYVEPGGYDRIVYRGDPSFVDGKVPEFIAFWVKDDRVLAGMNVNVWDVTDDVQALIRAGYSGGKVNLDKLADPQVPLTELII